MRNQINLVRKGLELGNVCLTDSLLSKQTRMPACVWSLVPGTLGCRGLCIPSQAVCRAGGGGAAHTGWAPRRGGGLDTPGTCFLLPGASRSHAGCSAECLQGWHGWWAQSIGSPPASFRDPSDAVNSILLLGKLKPRDLAGWSGWGVVRCGWSRGPEDKGSLPSPTGSVRRLWGRQGRGRRAGGAAGGTGSDCL